MSTEPGSEQPASAISDEEYLARFYRALTPHPLEPDDPRYVHLYDKSGLSVADPVAALAKTIEWTSESKQLFSGFRGTGKSTELRRLRQILSQHGNTKVVLCDMADYINLTTPIDISDLLLSVTGAFSDALKHPDLLGKDPSHEGYWTRFTNFVHRTRLDLPNASAGDKAGDISAGIKLNLKADPSFRQKIQSALQGHLGALVADTREFMEDCLKALRDRHGNDVRVVVLLDSIERIRGTSTNEEDVASSVENLFAGHPDKLALPYMHVVYTVPPWLKIKSPGVAASYDNSQQIPCVKVREQAGDPDRRCQAGLDTLSDMIARRGEWQRLLGERAMLDRLSLASGGYLRDLFRLLQAALRLASGHELPLAEERVGLAEQEIQRSYLPIANRDAEWLDRIERDKTTQLDNIDDLPRLSRSLDTHLVLAYRNGHEWWSVHPLIADEVKRQADKVRAARESN